MPSPGPAVGNHALAAAAEQSEQRRAFEAKVSAAQSDLVRGGDGLGLDQLRQEARWPRSSDWAGSLPNWWKRSPS